MVLTPIITFTLVYLLAYIVSNKLQFKFYIKIIIGLLILLISYLASAFYDYVTMLDQISLHEKTPAPVLSFCTTYLMTFGQFAWNIRPSATLLYTWQFFDVVYA